MKTVIITAIGFLLAVSGFGQTMQRSVIGSGGKSMNNGTVQLSSSIGEALVGTKTNGTFTLAQGFEQAEDVSTSIKENTIEVAYSLYPNPAVDNITLELLGGNELMNVNLSIVNMEGKIIETKQLNLAKNNTTKWIITTQNYAKGNYNLTIYNSTGKLIKNIRFIKN